MRKRLVGIALVLVALAAVVVAAAVMPRAPREDVNRTATVVVEPDASGEGETPSDGDGDDARYSKDEATHEAATRLMSVDAEYRDQEVLVTLPEGLSAEAARERLSGLSSIGSDASVEVLDESMMIVSVAQGSTVEDAVVEIASSGAVEAVQPNYVYHAAAGSGSLGVDLGLADALGTRAEQTDGSGGLQEGGLPALLGATAETPVAIDDPYAQVTHRTSSTFNQWMLASMNVFSAWSYLVQADGQVHNDVGVAVLDDGFRSDNPDLAANVKDTYDITAASTTVAEATGGHGTHVAGIVSAETNNRMGVSGVSYNAGLVLVNVFFTKNGAYGTDDKGIIKGYDYVLGKRTQHNIRVINVSIGGNMAVSADDALNRKARDAFNDYNIVSVAAAGNKISNVPLPYEDYPGDGDAFVSVINLDAAVGTTNVFRQSGSNYNLPGQKNKNVSAPGTSIWSTTGSSYGVKTGTSMASPAVAGVFSLLFASEPTLTASQARCVVYSTAADINLSSDSTTGLGWDEGTGYGEVDALAAMRNLHPSIQGQKALGVGDTETLSLECGNADAAVSWSSSDESVATVDASTGAVTAVGVGSATITGTFTETDMEGDSYSNSAAAQLVVSPKSIDAATIAVDDQTFSYAHPTCEPEVKVIVGGKVLTKDVDYTLSFSDNEHAGTASVIVTGAGGYTGQKSKSFSIAPYFAPADVTLEVTLSNTEGATSGSDPTANVRIGGSVVLAEGTDFDASYSYGMGKTGVATLTFKGDYMGSTTVNFSTKKDISLAQVTVPDQTYTGEALEPTATVTRGDATLVEGTDYTVTYDHNVDSGTGNATVTGKGEYQGHVTVGFAIARRSIAGASILATTTPTYTGSACMPALSVKVAGRKLSSGTDYAAVYSDNVDAGQGTVTLTGVGNYTGTATGSFDIDPADISGASVAASNQTYSGVALAPPATVTLTGKTLAGGSDYTASYSENTNAGTAKITVTGKGNYAGEAQGTFQIARASIAAAQVSVADQTYTGSALTPAPTVVLDGKTLVPGVEYAASYTNNVSFGTAGVTVYGQGNFTGQAAGSFLVGKLDLSSVQVSVAEQTYTGSALEPEPTVTTGGKALTRGRDYDVVYSNNTNVGTAGITIVGKGSCTGSKATTFQIVGADISGAQVSAAAQTYTGEALEPEPTVVLGGKTLVRDVDYTASYSGNVNAGAGTILVEGTGNYAGTGGGTFAIAPYDASADETLAISLAKTDGAREGRPPEVTVSLGEDRVLTPGTDYGLGYSYSGDMGTVTVAFRGNYRGTKAVDFNTRKIDVSAGSIEVANQSYTGSALEPEPTVVVEGVTLRKGVDYTVSYSGNTNPGTGVCTVTGTGNYQGTLTKGFTIARGDISLAQVSVADATYTGSELAPAVTVTMNGVTLREGTDYALSYSNNVRAGRGLVRVDGKGGYASFVMGAFTIAPKSIAGAKVSVPDQAYTGSKLYPEPTVTLDGVTLQRNVDYTVEYSDNVNVGTGTVTISGFANYKDSAAGHFSIVQRNVASAEVSVANQTYTGSALTPAPTVRLDGTTLRQGRDYNVSYANNVGPGTATLTITGTGGMTGSKSVHFSIARANISSANVAVVAQGYTGSALTPAPVVVLNGVTLTQNRDYSVSYANNVNPGTATATITGMGGYEGSVRANFAISDSGIIMHRLYNPYSSEHFYTASAVESAHLSSIGWRYEGMGWKAPSTGDPVYRLYNPYTGDHHYTLSAGERDALRRVGWNYEGVGWYSGGSTPLYRQYNPYVSVGSHNYTASAYENNALIRAGWRSEGIGWYGL